MLPQYLASYLLLKMGRLSPGEGRGLNGPRWLNTWALRLDRLGLSHGLAVHLLCGLGHDLTSLGFSFLIFEMVLLQSYCGDHVTHGTCFLGSL